ncbi:MAG TPA: PKD domain-containing protein, partial [Tepidisphaeraceae bacterium]|nr:PKD domain-containing protein [Tepidisphaeraceae bacterium]
PAGTGDTRFNARVQLGRGRHEITAYYANAAGEQRLTLVWKQPGADKYELIGPEAFGGVMPNVVSGVLEQRDRPVMADMKIEYVGESFFSDHYTHRYRFMAQGSRVGIAPRCDWDFGDGQVASGAVVEHVFLADGEHAVTLKARVGGQTEARTNKVAVSRLWEQIAAPPGDLPMTQAKVVAQYDPAKLPAKSLVWAVLLFARARESQPLEGFAAALAGMRDGADAGTVENAIEAASEQLVADGRFDAAGRVWEAVPANAACQPAAAKQFARVLLWRMGEFGRAVKVLEPQVRQHAGDNELQRLYGQALVLDQRATEGRKILESLPMQGPADRRGALSGALARTIEFYVTEGDCSSGEQAWEQWQQQYPADFLEGYSVLLRTRLMELAKASEGAAKVAEAFALAAPRSSYAPRLLDRASKLLEKSNPAKSRALKQMLKQKYPEDPLSQ